MGLSGIAPKAYKLDADITVRTRGFSTEQAQQLMEAVRQVCPYSNATRGNIDVRLHVETA